MNKPDMSPTEYRDTLKKVYEREGDPERAEGQRQYVRDKFQFYGLRAPEWRDLFKKVRENEGVFEGKTLYTFVRKCMQDKYREIHYSGLQMLEHQLDFLPEEGIEFLGECIRMNSWWDTVDWIAGLVGRHFKRFPQLQHPVCKKWISSGDIWLQRVAIIHQLKYKEETDEKLLFELILRVADTDEFFLQKASGWALRQYSKTDKQAVVEFIEQNELSSLTRREGLKWLKKQGEFE